jgi:uncharacterized protein (TIGR03437 family)
MRQACLLALLFAGTAGGAAPSYTAAGIVNAGNYSTGPFAPNSILTIFGSGLARAAQSLAASDIQGGLLPTEMQYTQVFVDNYPAPLFYVSDGQINFLVPANQAIGDAKIRIAREGNSGPEVTVSIVDGAPALFATAAGYAIATHADNSLVTPTAPAHADEIIVLYAIGLGKTAPNPVTGAIPQTAAQIVNLAGLKVTLGGMAITADRIKYAGLSPGSAGLYQINIDLPGGVGTDPEIRVAIRDQSSPPGLKLAIRL